MQYNYIAIEGCIGAGKTSLSERLASDFNAELILERFADNPFLAKFYKDPTHYAFPLEMTFLTDRYQQLKNLLSKRDLFTDLVVADYFIDKCAIFSKNNLQQDEYNLFLRVYEIISDFLPKPDILVYLYNTPENLLKNIVKRGRDYEQNIQAEYLLSIQENYLTFFKQRAQFPILIVESHTLDFVQQQNDYEKIKELFQNHYETGVHRIIL
ncbi:MAG: deoxynucleoside kinase [Bacteroidetes bacterium]|nr:deoxynucleoside kinase [Bacteroidota bacterium]MCL1968221.1 deoxynucleoside kinase [Bacteroidota bacterium]